MSRKINPYRVVLPKAWISKNKKNILKLDWNESTIKPSPLVKSEILKFLENEPFQWYPNLYNEELYNLISDYTSQNIETIQLFSGVDSLHEVISRTFLSEKDNVVIVGPTYDNFRACVEASKANVFNFDLDEDFKIDFKLLDDCIENTKPKLLYIVNPNNPTGNSHDLKSIQELLKKHLNTILIFDEAYYEFNKSSFDKDLREIPNLIICRTFSKAFGLASFRIGYSISNISIKNQLSDIRNPKSVSQLAQVAAIAALKDLDYTLKYIEEVNKSKKIIFEYFDKNKKFKVFNSDANFLFIECNSISLKKELITFLNKNNIFVRDFTHLKKLDNFFRITLGNSTQMNYLITVLDKVLK
jgi:histidinol-phosphate aminotransferase